MLTHPMAQRIEHWPLDRLIPFARNPRTHSDAQVAQIAASIAKASLTIERSYRRDVGMPLRPG